MRSIIWAPAVLVHVQSVIAACVDNTLEQLAETTVCNNVATQGAREIQSSLLQVAKDRDRTPPRDLTEQIRTNALQLSILPVFAYDHLAKAGGSFIRGVLAGPDTAGKIIPLDHLRIIEEAGTLTQEDRQHTFTVGSVRNPCDYYVSNWAFFGQTWMVPQLGGPEYFGVSPDLDTAEDQQRFSKWLRYQMPDGRGPGLLTTRILWSYFNESVGNAAQPEPNLRGWSEADRLIYESAAASFDPSAVDCWIKTETLTDDLSKCLTLFEKRAGSAIVNWKAFNEIIERRKREHHEQTLKNTGSANIWTKNSGHQPCEFYFDAANEAYVRNIDREIFSKFGYSTCCA